MMDGPPMMGGPPMMAGPPMMGPPDMDMGPPAAMTYDYEAPLPVPSAVSQGITDPMRDKLHYFSKLGHYLGCPMAFRTSMFSVV